MGRRPKEAKRERAKGEVRGLQGYGEKEKKGGRFATRNKVLRWRKKKLK